MTTPRSSKPAGRRMNCISGRSMSTGTIARRCLFSGDPRVAFWSILADAQPMLNPDGTARITRPSDGWPARLGQPSGADPSLLAGLSRHPAPGGKAEEKPTCTPASTSAMTGAIPRRPASVFGIRRAGGPCRGPGGHAGLGARESVSRPARVVTLLAGTASVKPLTLVGVTGPTGCQ